MTEDKVCVGYSCGTGEKIILVGHDHRGIMARSAAKAISEVHSEQLKNQEPLYVQHDKKKMKKK